MNLIEHNNRSEFERNANVGDSFWLCIASTHGKNDRFYINVKPCLVTITGKRNYGTEESPRWRFDWDISNSKALSKRRRGDSEVMGWSSVLTLTEEECVNLYDAKITELANYCNSYSRKQKILENCMGTHPGEDTVANDARTWRDGLTDLEKTYIEKLIEITT